MSAHLQGCIAAIALGAALAGPGFPPVAHAQERPLLVEGATTIYQRVLTRPGAAVHGEPAGERTGRYEPFQPLYVYEHRDGWLRVGTSPSRPPAGWISVERSIDWKQNIVAAFTNPTNRNRQVLFDTRGNLEWLLNHEAIRAVQEQLISDADNDRLNPERGVLAAEPGEYVDIRERFYLMPILDFAEDFHPLDYTPLLLMRVASLPLIEGPAMAPEPVEFDAGVMFVIDTTQSMDPYIRTTRRAIEDIMAGVSDSDIGEKIHFGAIGFRDNADAAPGIVYRTRVLSALERDIGSDAIVAALADTDTARVSSVGFNEDSLAGVEDAILETDWDQNGVPFAGKYIILVTDAGPKGPGDPNARTNISAGDVQTLAENKGIAILTLHLKTPAGQGNHRYAERQYRALSQFDQETYYFAVDEGSEAAFDAQVRAIVNALLDHVRIAMGRAPVAEDIDPSLVNLGYAMRLRFLGERRGTAAPEVLSTWITDRAAEAPEAWALTPRLLITKNELSTIASVLEKIVEHAESAQSSESQNLSFRRLRDAISRLAVNPDLVVNTEFETLGGAVGEFLANLPYQSRIMDFTEDRWANAGTLRREIIDELRQKTDLYRRLHNDPGNWIALYDGAPDGEHVFAMPLKALP
ncbi:MAG: VWA domain-containing protein [Paracoccaceae bacterium]|nr:VWA domain-containing protein [Paracoccaceae bacterium]